MSTTPRQVEAALNGGDFTITTETLQLADAWPVVRLAVHADRFLLYPDEARRLAVALIEAAAAAEQPQKADWP